MDIIVIIGWVLAGIAAFGGVAFLAVMAYRPKREVFGPTPRPFGKQRRLSHDDMEDALQRISPRAWPNDESGTYVTRRRR